MEQLRTFHVRGALALPIGHRVEISIFALNTGAFKVKLEPQPYDPLIRDLSTGVVYARNWHYQQNAPDDVTKLPNDLRSDLAVAERVVGEVRGTRIVSGVCPDESGRNGWVTSLLVAIAQH
jgi:hypothetical protein